MTDLEQQNTEVPEEGKKKRGRKPKPSADVTDHYIPGEPKDNWLLERIRIIRERRALRKDLKRKGITSRKDFEAIAESLGLVLWKDIPFLLWWHHGWRRWLANFGLGSLLAAAAALLALLFLLSYITEKKGAFTINLTAEMLRAGFVLYDSAKFEHPETRLFSLEVEQVNNITLEDIPKDIDQIDGPHNGRDYVAYTFYIRNEGQEPQDYAWYLNMLGDTMNVSEAVWLMLFEDGAQVIYAEPTAAGEAEQLYGFREPLFAEAAYAYDTQYYVQGERYGITTTPFVQEDIVAQGLIQGVQPGEHHKYTVVIWVEGYDPECTDAIFGGFAKYSMRFENVTDKELENIFSGLYRTEYRDYGLNPDTVPKPPIEMGPLP